MKYMKYMKTRALKATTIEVRCGHRKLSVSAVSAALGSTRVPQPRLANSVDDSHTGIAKNNGDGGIKKEEQQRCWKLMLEVHAGSPC